MGRDLPTCSPTKGTFSYHNFDISIQNPFFFNAAVMSLIKAIRSLREDMFMLN